MPAQTQQSTSGNINSPTQEKASIDNEVPTTELNDSDETWLDSLSPSDKVQQLEDEDSDSSIEIYTLDEDYTGPAYASQPCSKHGASYTPPGWKHIHVKMRKLELNINEDTNDDWLRNIFCIRVEDGLLNWYTYCSFLTLV